MRSVLIIALAASLAGCHRQMTQEWLDGPHTQKEVRTALARGGVRAEPLDLGKLAAIGRDVERANRHDY